MDWPSDFQGAQHLIFDLEQIVGIEKDRFGKDRITHTFGVGLSVPFSRRA